MARRVTILVGALVLLCVTTALGDSTETPVATPVSTSPIVDEATDATTRRASPDSERAQRPLTRAAARSQIEQITPIAWLSRFGRVDIDSRD